MFNSVGPTPETRSAIGQAKSRASEIFGSPLDVDSLLDQCMGNLTFAMSLLSEFEKTGIPSVEVIRQHLENAQYDALAGDAHSLKGVAGIVKAKSLQQLAIAMEAASQAQAEDQLVSLVHDLGNEMQRCLGFVAAFRAEHEAA